MLRQIRDVLVRHERTLWWLHSVWALAFGVGIMWLGARRFDYLRLAIFHIAFIWIASLVVLRWIEDPDPASVWRRRLLVALNYFNRNFYQQILFFVLPIYFMSATAWAPNTVFVGIIAVSAVVSTLDVVYDRRLASRRVLSAVFFAFNLFVTINVMLPILWATSHVTAMRTSAALALLAFTTIYYERRHHSLRESAATVAAVAMLLTTLVEWGRPLIPPAPLRLAASTFGTGVDVDARLVTGALGARPADGRVYVMTAVVAPQGLRDNVRHRWFRDGEPFYQSPAYAVTGGREEGYRLWTYATPGPDARRLRVDVETAGGQLIGRVTLP